MIRIALTGAGGRMGRLIMDEIAASAPDMILVAAFDIMGVGQRLTEDVTLSDSRELASVLETSRPDVLIDFTVASAAIENVWTAAEHGIAVVVGTTGFSPDQMHRMTEAIEGRVPAVISPNFSVGVNVFWKIIEMAAASLQGYDVEVIEAHHNKKKDAPSGTALKTVEVLRKGLGIDQVVYGREGLCPRGCEIGVHAIRAGDIVGDHTVLFAGPGERIEIKHQAHSRTAFASGAVRAARWVVTAQKGIHSMAEVLSGQGH